MKAWRWRRGWQGALVLALVWLHAACEPSRQGAPAAEVSEKPGVAEGAEVGSATVSTPEVPPEAVDGVPAGVPAPVEDGVAAERPIIAALEAAPAPAATARLTEVAEVERVQQALATFYSDTVGRRIYVQVDKPLYKPGETLWIKSWDLAARSLVGEANGATRYQLISPRGAVVNEKWVETERGLASNDFVLGQGIEGGEYVVRVIADDGVTGERPVIVAAYEAPRIKKKLEFVRKAYGPGDEVRATLELWRATGEALAHHPLRGRVRLDGEDLAPLMLQTDATGAALLRFVLPESIEVGDGILTVMVEDGGVTESISKRVPIVMKRLRFSMFPEGGQLVQGLATRVYFEAKTPLGKAADVEGRVVDAQGVTVTRFSSVRDGLGRFELTPSTGQSYRVEITQPEGISETYPLPFVEESGCVLNTYDDLDGTLMPLRAVVRCTETRKVVVVATLREQILDVAAVEVSAGGEGVVYLEPEDRALARAQGIARVTLLDEQLRPLAERLVYRNRRNGLQIEVAAHRESYMPRDQVSLTVTTRDGDGQPVAAELALSVVDDTVVSHADDKTGHMLSRLYLEPEVPGEVEEPNFYFDLREERSAAAMDMLMGTRGWRRFEWQPVFEPPPKGQDTGVVKRADVFPPAPDGGELLALAPEMDEVIVDLALAGMGLEEEDDAAPPAAEPMAVAAPAPVIEGQMQEKAEEAPDMARRQAARPRVAAEVMAADRGRRGERMMADEMRGGGLFDEEFPAPAVRVMAPVRVFPVPDYAGVQTGPRDDFRDTVYWAPRVKTNQRGEVVLTFYLSDAITSFRVFAEGVGAGQAGRQEKVIQSKLPFSMEVKLPLELSAGDRLALPIIFSNEGDEALEVTWEADVGALMQVGGGELSRVVQVGARARESVFLPVEVSGVEGQSRVRIAAQAKGLQDELVRQVKVMPRGFPQESSFAGSLKGETVHQVDLREAEVGTIHASIRLYPSPVATMVSGLEGMLRQPTGCFEQASSANYPNVMVMNYLQTHEVADPQLRERSAKLLDEGYQRLVGYETRERGYEWFGGAPGHEALTAYGLLQFTDMAHIYEVDRQMVERTAAWLLARRDGQGGFRRNDRALDSFGRADPKVTDAYLVYALTEAGYVDLQPELARQLASIEKEQDAYVLALATHSLLNVPAHRAAGLRGVERLVGMQGAEGAWTQANHSITRSTGHNLWVETTALATMALLKAGGHEEALRRGMAWLTDNRQGFGSWGATQATVLALRAMTAYDAANRRAQVPGHFKVLIDGQLAAEISYEAGHRDPLIIEGLAEHLGTSLHRVELVHESALPIPYTLVVSYRSQRPASSEAAAITVSTSLERQSLKMGETVRLKAVVSNKKDEGQPMTLARIGLPGTLTFQTWQLRELREKGEIAFYETGAREVILYFRDMRPNEVREIPLELVAFVPGEAMGPASSAYLYYTDDLKHWADGLAVSVSP